MPSQLPWEASPDISKQMRSLRLLVIHGIWLVLLSWFSYTPNCTIFDSVCVLLFFTLVAPQGQGLLRKHRLCWSGRYLGCETVLQSRKSYHGG